MILIKHRLQISSRVALIHFVCGLIWIAFLAIPVFGLWFPYPYREITGGGDFFYIIFAVDVVCGPILTLILFDPRKARWKWRMDLLLILTLQIGAMIYGVDRLIAMRPVYLAYEGDRFRVIRANDFSAQELGEANPSFSDLSWTGPRLISVKLLSHSDPGYMNSIVRSMNGEPPSFRPSRWEQYDLQLKNIRASLRSLDILQSDGASAKELMKMELKCKCRRSLLGYLPLISNDVDDWIVVLNVESGLPVGYLNIDGW